MESDGNPPLLYCGLKDMTKSCVGTKHKQPQGENNIISNVADRKSATEQHCWLIKIHEEGLWWEVRKVTPGNRK